MIKDEDSIAKDLKYHEHCYTDFTRSRPNIESNEKESSYDKGDFEKVKNLVSEEVISNGRVISMRVLHIAYGLNENDHRYRNKLKGRIQRQFGDKIIILPSMQNNSEIIVSKELINQETLLNKDNQIKSVAKIIKDDIKEHYSQNKNTFPICLKQVKEMNKETPHSLRNLLENVLKSDSHSLESRPTLSRLCSSIEQDIVHAVTRGEQITEKHFLLGLGLHNLTGQKTVIEVLNKMGHCISYPSVCDILTAQANAMQEKFNSPNYLPVVPQNNEVVLIHFWADNFDTTTDQQYGGGAINITHLMAFQEGISQTSSNWDVVKRPKKIKLNIEPEKDCCLFLNNHASPPISYQEQQNEINFDRDQFKLSSLVWVFLRKQNSFNQTVPSFSAFLMQKRLYYTETINKTIETYLPPINSKVTSADTIEKYFNYFTSLANTCNMPYVNITLDVGAAINAFKFQWSNWDEYKHIFIHLGTFHFMKENFQVDIFLLFLLSQNYL